MKRVLITGGKGYLGGRICEALCRDPNLHVTVTSRDSRKIDELPSVDVIKVDTRRDDVKDVLEGVHTVIHLAALDARACLESPEEAVDVNVTDTVRWLRAASAVGISQFIYFSTVHVYGSDLKGDITENSAVNPIHPYSITHKCAEDYVLYYSNIGGFKGHVMRVSNGVGYSVGEVKQENLLVPSLCKSAITKNRITLKSNPYLMRDFVSIADVTRAVEIFVKRSDTIETSVFNLTCGESNSLMHMAIKVQKVLSEGFGINAEIETTCIDTGAAPKSYKIVNSKIRSYDIRFENNYDSEISGLIKGYQESEIVV